VRLCAARVHQLLKLLSQGLVQRSVIVDKLLAHCGQACNELLQVGYPGLELLVAGC
jgi:hypothetical protein